VIKNSEGATMLRILLTTLAGTILILPVLAAEPIEIKTVVTERGKQLLNDDFGKPLAKQWKPGKGKWEIVDDALKGVEVKDDMHAASLRRPIPFHDAVVQYSFKLDGAKTTTFSINAAKGHICRVIVKPNGFTVQKDDQDGKDGPDKAMALDTCSVDVKPGEWHTLLIELQGKEMLARLDDKHVAFGAHDTFDVDKTSVGLTVSGDSVSFKDLKIWEASANKEWETTKAKLLEARKAGNPPK
jgi:hypothetical protein